MATAVHNAKNKTNSDKSQDVVEQVKETTAEVQKKISPLKAFVQKVGNDGVSIFAGTLAYSLLTAVGPLLIGLLGVLGWGYFLTGHTDKQLSDLVSSRLSGVPASGISSVVHAIQTQAGTIGIIGVILSLIGGSGFFQSIDYVLSVIYRLKQRDFIHEWMMSLTMVLVLIPLIVVMTLATSVPQFANAVFANAIPGIVLWVLSVASGVGAAFLLFLAIYKFVPNQDVPFKDIWRGALLAGALLEAYTLIFPFYASTFLKPTRFGAQLGFALVVIAFFYYFAIILLLGAELNSWLLGERETQGNLPELLHRLQQHGQITIDSEDKGVEHTHEDGETHTHPISDTDKYHKHPQSEEKEGNRIMNRLLPTKSTSRPPAVRQGALAYSDTGAVLDPKKPTFPVYMLGALAAAGLAYDMIRRRPAAPAKPNRTR